jgi:hypothetical protein
LHRAGFAAVDLREVAMVPRRGVLGGFVFLPQLSPAG